MNASFADTFFFLALLNGKGQMNPRAVEAHASGRPTVTSDFVLLALGDHLSARLNRSVYVEFYALLRDDPGIEVVPVSDDLLRRGRELYAGRPDKDWSLTDCTSFVVMTDRRITDALTGDHHFEQAGFNALLK